MDNYTIVRSEHLNHYGHLFGGTLLRWVDEFAWIFASLDFRGCTLVTVGMDRSSFKERINSGSILRFNIQPVKLGTSSITYSVDVYADAPGASEEKLVFSTNVTFVRIDENGRKTPLPPIPVLRSETIRATSLS
ncbi:MAG: acyl-CoA thioesterase [Geobacteraceae bacterium]